MPSMRGRYEYDDEELSPGKKSEGGLHQNLFDKNGKLKGSARFIPDETAGEFQSDETDSAYGSSSGEYRSESQEQRDELAQAVVRALIEVAVEYSKPYAKEFWAAKLRPAMDLRIKVIRERRTARKRRRVERSGRKVVSVEVPPIDAIAASDPRANMPLSEAQARLLMAIAAKRFAEEQMHLLRDADVHPDEGLEELEQALSLLPSDQVATMLANIEANPALLAGDALAALGVIAGVAPADRLVPIEQDQARED